MVLEPINYTTMIQSYKWTLRNKLPFNWYCPICHTYTEIIDSTKDTLIKCSNDNCPMQFKFV